MAISELQVGLIGAGGVVVVGGLTGGGGLSQRAPSVR